MAFVNGTQPTEMCGDQPHAVANLPQYLQRAIYAPKRGETKGDEVTITDAPKLAAPLPKQAPGGAPARLRLTSALRRRRGPTSGRAGTCRRTRSRPARTRSREGRRRSPRREASASFHGLRASVLTSSVVISLPLPGIRAGVERRGRRPSMPSGSSYSVPASVRTGPPSIGRIERTDVSADQQIDRRPSGESRIAAPCVPSGEIGPGRRGRVDDPVTRQLPLLGSVDENPLPVREERGRRDLGDGPERDRAGVPAPTGAIVRPSSGAEQDARRVRRERERLAVREAYRGRAVRPPEERLRLPADRLARLVEEDRLPAGRHGDDARAVEPRELRLGLVSPCGRT